MAYRQTAAPDQLRANRVRRINGKERLNQEAHEIDYRFVREVERLERDGRVANRVTLERDLGMSKGRISQIRAGKLGISPEHIKRLKEKYNGDFFYILFGQRDPYDTSGPVRRGQKLNTYTPFTHVYNDTARWKVGPRPEEDPDHCPRDPENLLHPSYTSEKTKPLAPVEPEEAGNYSEVRRAVQGLVKKARRQVGVWFAPVVKVLTDAERITDVAIVLGAGAWNQEWYKAVGAAGWRKLEAEAAKTADATVTTEAEFSDKRFKPLSLK